MARDCKANIIVVENQEQLDKILEVTHFSFFSYHYMHCALQAKQQLILWLWSWVTNYKTISLFSSCLLMSSVCIALQCYIDIVLGLEQGRTTLNHKCPSRVDGWMGNV